jgi:hypothetical protein
MVEFEIEDWKKISVFGSEYEISSAGCIRSVDKKISVVRRNNYKPLIFSVKGQLLKSNKSKNGYIYININSYGLKKRVLAHRLIAEAFIPNPLKKPYVNHINGVKHDNRVENIEWVTASENQIHAVKAGISKFRIGESHHNSKLTKELAASIRELAYTHSQSSIAKILHLGVGTINRVLNNQTFV